MNCKDVESLAYEIARDRMIQATVRDDAFRHIAKCEVCASRLDEELALTRDLRALRSAMQSIKAPVAIRGRLLEQMRAEKRATSVIVPSTWHRYGKYVAVAAMLLLVFGIVVMRLRIQSLSSAGSTEVSPLTVATSGPSVDAKIPTVSVNTVQPTKVAISKPTVSHNRVKTTRPAKTNPKPVNAVDQSREEIATDFLPIGHSSLINVQDGGQVVRMAVPRSTMARFGFPVNMDRYDEKVIADVLVSSDGMARAIRFVQ